MKDYGLVSIITPCYNAEKYIAETIESVLNQTYTNWELLITDDCSTDRSVEIIKKYQLNDRRIKYYTTKRNSGHPSEPRNISLSHVSGEYVALLDSDDLWFPHKLEEKFKYIDKNKYSIITSYVQVITDDGKIKNKLRKNPAVSTYRSMLKNMGVNASAVLFTREVANQLNFPRCQQEDFVAWLDVLKKGYKVYNTKSVLAYYRISSNSRSRNKFKMFKERWKILRKHEHLSFISTTYYMFWYSVYGVIKNYL